MVSVILPVYNECNRLESCVRDVSDYFSQVFPVYEIIIIEDNSTDQSLEVAQKIAGENRHVRLIHNDERLGRGASLNEAIQASKYNYVIYMDADLATDLKYAKKLVDCLNAGASVATGSRLMEGSRVSRPAVRDIPSRGYNFLVRLLFESRIHDHQCGFKGFNRNEILPVLDMVKDNHWFWDTELLLLCQLNDMRIDEFPVEWRHNGGNELNASKVKVLKDIRAMARKLVTLKVRTLTHDMQIGHRDQSGISSPGRQR